jgi:chaperonin cofactor prefoldin
MAQSNAERMRAYRRRRKEDAEFAAVAALAATRKSHLTEQQLRDRIEHLETRLAVLLDGYTAAQEENQRLKAALLDRAVPV